MISGAIASKKSDYISLGLDIESIGRIQLNDWNNIFTPNEIHLISSYPYHEDNISTILFSLKEAYYKLQFQITSNYLDFLEMEIRITRTGYTINSTKKDKIQSQIAKNVNLISSISSEGIVTTIAALENKEYKNSD